MRRLEVKMSKENYVGEWKAINEKYGAYDVDGYVDSELVVEKERYYEEMQELKSRYLGEDVHGLLALAEADDDGDYNTGCFACWLRGSCEFCYDLEDGILHDIQLDVSAIAEEE